MTFRRVILLIYSGSNSGRLIGFYLQILVNFACFLSNNNCLFPNKLNFFQVPPFSKTIRDFKSWNPHYFSEFLVLIFFSVLIILIFKFYFSYVILLSFCFKKPLASWLFYRYFFFKFSQSRIHLFQFYSDQSRAVDICLRKISKNVLDIFLHIILVSYNTCIFIRRSKKA